jgi:hypothetical protein
MIERITTANRDLANQMIDKAVQPGQAGKEGRAFLRGLVQKNPGAFPPGFLEWLDSIEETPEEREAAEQKIEEEDPDQKFMMRHKAGMAQRNAVIDEWNKNLEKTKHAKAEALKKSREVNAYNKELDEMLGEDPASVKRAATLAEGKAKHEAHEALPEVINQRKMEAMKNDLMREAQARDRANQRRGGPAATPEFLNQTVAESMRAMTEGTSRRNAMDVGINRVSEKEALSRLSASKRGGDIANLGHMEEQVKRQVQQAAMMNAPADFNVEMIGEWVRKAMADLPNTGNQIMPALQRTIWEVRAHLQHQNEMQNAQWQRMNGNQLFNSTQLNIGPS